MTTRRSMTRQEAEKLVHALTKKLGRVPTFGDIAVELDRVQDPSAHLPPSVRPSISAEERQQLNSELMARIGNYAPFERIKSLLEKGADPNGRDFEGATPLMYAMYKYMGRGFPIYNMLKAWGADFGARDKYGYTPLMWAAKACHLDACRWVADNGEGKIDLNALSSDNKTALDIAHELRKYNEDAPAVCDYLASIGVKRAAELK